MQVDAEYWRTVCTKHLNGRLTDLIKDHWCRRVLRQAADSVMPIGINGWSFVFLDGSTLVATAEVVFVTRTPEQSVQ